MNLQKLIASYVKDSGRSFRVLAKEIGVNYATLHRFVKGEGIDSDNLLKLIQWTLSPKKEAK